MVRYLRGLRYVSVYIIIAMLVACGGSAEPEAGETGAAPEANATEVPAAGDALRPVTMAMSFIPNVQFAMFYVADSKGYYADAGLDITFDYNFENDVMQRVATWPDSDVEFAMAGATSVLLARQQGLPVVTVATIYQEFPVVFFSKAANAINSVEDMQGKSIGIPGRFGASYYALLALLYANDMQESDLNIQEIGFSQAQAVLEDRVDVATGYAMNEPLLLEAQGEEVSVLRVADMFPLASDGIVTHADLIDQEPELVQAFVQATMRGLQDTLDNPDEAFDLSLEYIPEAELGDAELQRAVLQASLPYWHSATTEQTGLGYTDPQVWEATQTFMWETELLTQPLEVDEAFTNAFILSSVMSGT